MSELQRQRILPLAVPGDAEETAALADGLRAARVGAVEVGLRGPYALEAIRVLAESDTGLLIGAGTVRTPEQAEAAAAAGAAFLVSPGLSGAVVRRAVELGLPIVPGVATASEVMRACDMGIELMKLFPSNLIGGLGALDAFHSVFPEVRFIPSGGVSQQTLAEFLGHPAVQAVSGSWITSGDLLRSGAAAVAAAAEIAMETVRRIARGNA